MNISQKIFAEPRTIVKHLKFTSKGAELNWEFVILILSLPYSTTNTATLKTSNHFNFNFSSDGGHILSYLNVGLVLPCNKQSKLPSMITCILKFSLTKSYKNVDMWMEIIHRVKATSSQQSVQEVKRKLSVKAKELSDTGEQVNSCALPKQMKASVMWICWALVWSKWEQWHQHQNKSLSNGLTEPMFSVSWVLHKSIFSHTSLLNEFRSVRI